MSRRIMTTRGEDGSLPMAMLASIVVAGLITVVLARVTAGEGAVRFDRDFTEALQVADVGINRGLFALNEGTTPPSTATTQTVDGIEYTWSATQDPDAPREWEVVSRSDTASGVQRQVRATIEEQPLFFPGAFGDKLIALNGSSTDVDSYNSACGDLTPTCGWGNTTADRYEEEFGTGNGSIGTNEVLDFTANVSGVVRPGGAYLYDWEANRANNITASDPFGDRCNGNPCTTEYVSTINEPLEIASTEQMAFITEKFEDNSPDYDALCADTSTPRHMGDWTLRTSDGPLTAYGDPDTGGNDATATGFTDFYCADSLEILGDIELADSVTPANPVVIFVKDYFAVPTSGAKVACHNADGTTWCDKNDPRNVRPQASRLQIYVAGIPAAGTTAGDISFKSQVMFAGVVYAPLSRCGGSGGGGVDVYGAAICGTMDNVGNWDFHYDDALGVAGNGVFNIAFWEEVAPTP